MALPPPDGIAYFPRSSLKTSGSWAFDPENPRDFYSHYLLQILPYHLVSRDWNSNTCKLPYKHPRGEEWYWNKNAYDDATKYTYLTVLYGTANNEIKRIHRFHTNGDYWTHRNDGQTVVYVPIPMPNIDDDETHMFVDLTFPIKKIFFPLAQVAAEDYKSQCTYGHLDFTRINLTVKSNEGINVDFPSGDKLGLGLHPYWTLKFDMVPLLIWLAIPRTKRDKSVKPGNFITAVACRDINTGSAHQRTFHHLQPPHIIDIVTVINSGQLLNLQYAPCEEDPNFLTDIFKNFASVGLGFVPGIGPLLAISFDVAFDAINDWDEFSKEYKDIPGLGAAVIDSRDGLKIASKFLKKRKRLR